MFNAMIQALGEMMLWPNPLFLVVGSLIGLIFGVIPGLSGATAIVLMIPLTYNLTIFQSIMLLLPALGGSAFGGSISAILLNIPGTSVNVATAFDGYPLTKQGRAGEAIAASATASALGAISGLIVLTISIPILIRILLLFGPAEYFMMTFFGLTIIALAVEGSLLTSMLSGLLGIILSFHGFVQVVGGLRFTYGIRYLWDGFNLTPVFLGLFAINGAVQLLLGQEETIAGGIEKVKGGIVKGIISVFVNWKLFIQSSLIGIIIGIVPGVGGAVSNFAAYIFAVRASKNPETFGKGNIQGVIASESANDSKDGGALMPTLSLGIPGSVAMAILIGAFSVHGINMGRSLFTQNLYLVWGIILALFFSNILVSTFGLLSANFLVKFAVIPIKLFAPVIICISLLGAFAVNRRLFDCLVAVMFGIIGYFFTKFNYSRVALVIGLMLGSRTETYFFQALQISRGSYAIFWTRPISLFLGLFVISIIISPLVRRIIKKPNNKNKDKNI
jgi:putative tricarboxylic transport membrane protein